jgi:D-alanine-D-alanine ligase
LSGAEAEAVRTAALETWKALGCEGFVRVDLILDGYGVAQVLEVNAVPGLTDTSLFPMAAEAAGLGFEELCSRIAGLATAR